MSPSVVFGDKALKAADADVCPVPPLASESAPVTLDPDEISRAPKAGADAVVVLTKACPAVVGAAHVNANVPEEVIGDPEALNRDGAVSETEVTEPWPP